MRRNAFRPGAGSGLQRVSAFNLALPPTVRRKQPPIHASESGQARVHFSVLGFFGDTFSLKNTLKRTLHMFLPLRQMFRVYRIYMYVSPAR